MTSSSRSLSKSRFKIGHECPTKLYFSANKEYGSTSSDNPFLRALADGGFQVGALAQLQFPGGTLIDTIDKDEALQQTNELLKQDKVTIYEAAIQFENFFIRIDILRKAGNSFELIEVKSKTVDPTDPEVFYKKAELKKGLYFPLSNWEPYFMDVAFQTFVLKNAFPKHNVTSSLVLVNKTARATVDGLNQRFILIGDGHSKKTSVELAPGTTPESIGDPVLTQINLDAPLKQMLERKYGAQTFADYARSLAQAYCNGEMIAPQASANCKTCEYRIPESMKEEGKKSGFDECWKTIAKLSTKELKKPFVFDLWNFRGTEKVLAEGRYLLEDLEREDVAPKSASKKDPSPGLTQFERQWIQIEKSKKGDSDPHLDLKGLEAEMKSWTYPLHFIDFETAGSAIPFHKGRRPYETIAFQFSHHLVHSDGRIEHKTQYIHRERGVFPNFDFVRNLKRCLEKDDGTIFRYAAHENSVLCQIISQLEDSQEKDKAELIAWIKTITKSSEDHSAPWEGPRNMVDLKDLVQRYDYHPETQGSNSLKKVLPAILRDSPYLIQKYSKPIYGAANGITSLNYKNFSWMEMGSDAKPKDPYKLLPPIFTDLDLETMDSLITEGSIADGGAAMTAYARMQFTQMSGEERNRVCDALLRYCELDTFAMVLLYEYWANLVTAQGGKKAA